MPQEIINVPALRIEQRETELFITRLTLSEINSLYDIDRFDVSDNPQGYQRALDDSRARQVKHYVQKEQPGTLPAAVVFNCRDPKGLEFKESPKGIGRLSIMSRLWLVDGQHRLSGLEMAARANREFENYAVPAVILNSQDRGGEMEHFFVINDRQKGVPVDLVLRFLVSKNNGHESFERKDEVRAIETTDILAQDKESCWFRRIRLTNEPRMRTHTITERSFHRSLLPAVKVPMMKRANPKQSALVLRNYWNAIRDIVPEPFAAPDDYLVQRTVGAYTLHLLFPYAFEQCMKDGSFSQPNFVEVLLKTNMKKHDWRREVAGAYGGIQGFKKLAEKYIQRIPETRLIVK
jgi:DGQHR domain-containing protein